MKVITQLIRHFWQRGALTRLEVEYLLRHDFVRAGDLPGYKPSRRPLSEEIGPEDDTPVEAPDSLEIVEEELVRRKPHVRRTKQEGRGGELRAVDLLERLRGEYERRDIDLASVLALGQRFKPVDRWWEAAAELRGVTPQRFHRGLCAELREGDVLLGDIWQASDPEPFHLLIDDEEARGRAARAFLALLVATGPDALGKYAWILKYDEMQTLINLRVLHNRLLECLPRIYRHDRQLLTHALAKNSDPVQLWALVILYNAFRNPGLGETPQYGKEYGPVPLPDYEIWKHAWTAALRMDRTKVFEFLIAKYHVTTQTEVDNSELPRDQSHYISFGHFFRWPMMCPVGWHLP